MTDTNAFDTLIRCEFCYLPVRDPLMLPCLHDFCKICITHNAKNGKITCKICQVDFPIQINTLDKTLVGSNLAKFILDFKTITESNIHTYEIDYQEGECSECIVPQNKIKTPEEVDTKPKVQLSKCHHCELNLCSNCRNRHYTTIRRGAVKVLEFIENGSLNIKKTNEQLIEARKRKIQELNKTKTEIVSKHQEIIEKLKEEQLNLLKSIDNSISMEEIKIQLSQNDVKRLDMNKEVSSSIKKSLSNESDVKKLSEICEEFSRVQVEWGNKLKSDAMRVDTTKETKPTFVPTKLKDSLMGIIVEKPYNTKVKPPAILNDNTGNCNIL